MEFLGFDQLGSWTCRVLGESRSAIDACSYMEGRTSVGMTIIAALVLTLTGLAWRRLP